MKKQLLALAVMGALTFAIAQAETALYGAIQYGVEYGYNHGEPDAWETINRGYLYDHYSINNKGKRGINVEDVGSRIGLKGSEALGNGVKVLYQLEWGFDGAEGLGSGSGFENRIAMIALAGSFGTFAIGRLDNPFKVMLIDRSAADDLNVVGISGAANAAGDVFWGVMGSINTFDSAMEDRVGNAIAYISPTWGGFGFNVAAIMDGVKDYDDPGILNKKRAVDIWTVNLNYAHESGFYANAGYITGDATKDTKRAFSYGLQIGFSSDQWGVNANLARGETKGKATFGVGNDRSADFWSGVTHSTSNRYKHTTFGWDLGGYFSFGADYASSIRATVGQAKADKKHQNNDWLYSNYISNKERNKLTTWSVGFEQKLSTRTLVWVEYNNTNIKQSFNSQQDYYNFDSAGKYRSNKYKNDRVNVGIRHDF